MYLNTSNCCSSFPRMPSSYQVVLWKQESFVVLRPLQSEFFRILLGETSASPHSGCTLFTMYRISRDNEGTILVCLACTHTERVQDFNGDIGNQRTLAAHAMLKHVHAEHGRETHVRAMAMER